MKTSEIYEMALLVLDEPTEKRIIVQTDYPDFEGDDYAYFMVDRGAPAGEEEPARSYGYWWVTDSLGQSKKLATNGELVDFLEDIEEVASKAWVEGF